MLLAAIAGLASRLSNAVAALMLPRLVLLIDLHRVNFSGLRFISLSLALILTQPFLVCSTDPLW